MKNNNNLLSDVSLNGLAYEIKQQEINQGFTNKKKNKVSLKSKTISRNLQIKLFKIVKY